MNRIRNRVAAVLWRGLRESRGVAIVEFALALPLMITLFYGVIEVTRYILITQKTEKLAYAVADVTAQQSVATKANLDQVFAATANIMDPYSTGPNSRVIVSSIYRPANPNNGTSIATINWQYAGAGTLASTSLLGAVGATPAMPGGFTFDEKENVIAAEAYYQFSPLLTGQWFGTTIIRRVAFYKPRLAALTTAPS